MDCVSFTPFGLFEGSYRLWAVPVQHLRRILYDCAGAIGNRLEGDNNVSFASNPYDVPGRELCDAIGTDGTILNQEIVVGPRRNADERDPSRSPFDVQRRQESSGAERYRVLLPFRDGAGGCEAQRLHPMGRRYRSGRMGEGYSRGQSRSVRGFGSL